MRYSDCNGAVGCVILPAMCYKLGGQLYNYAHILLIQVDLIAHHRPWDLVSLPLGHTLRHLIDLISHHQQELDQSRHRSVLIGQSRLSLCIAWMNVLVTLIHLRPEFDQFRHQVTIVELTSGPSFMNPAITPYWLARAACHSVSPGWPYSSLWFTSGQSLTCSATRLLSLSSPQVPAPRVRPPLHTD